MEKEPLLMAKTRLGTTRTRIIAFLAATALLATPLAIAAAVSGTAAAAAPAAPGATPVEAQQFSGDWTEVQDALATNGTAVVINSGAISTPTTTLPGSYTLNFRVRSGAARVLLTLNGQQIDTAVLFGGTWQTVSVPVRVTGTPTWAIEQLPAVGYTPQPVYVDWM